MKKTTKIFAIALTAFALFIGTRSNAQSTPKSKFRFGIGVDGLLPVGNLSNSENFGLGITPRLQYGISNNVALTFTTGLYHFFPKDKFYNNGVQSSNWGLNLIPAKFGIKAFVSSNIYIGAEAGLGFQVDDGGGDSKFLVAGGIGYATKKWDIGVRYESFAGNGYRNGIIGLRLAYGFGL